MDSFELNKIAGAVFFTLLVYLGVQNLGDILFHVETADANAYIVEGLEVDAVSSSTASAEPEVDILALLQTASVEKGAKVAKKCVSCHAFEKGGATKIGPALWGIVDRWCVVNDRIFNSSGVYSLYRWWYYFVSIIQAVIFRQNWNMIFTWSWVYILLNDSERVRCVCVTSLTDLQTIVSENALLRRFTACVAMY